MVVSPLFLRYEKNTGGVSLWGGPRGENGPREYIKGPQVVFLTGGAIKKTTPRFVGEDHQPGGVFFAPQIFRPHGTLAKMVFVGGV